eukprot:1062616-Lingulodinium_polyedra.AAC.1
MPESTPSFGGSSEDATARAAPTEATAGEPPVPTSVSELSGASDPEAGRVAKLALLAAMNAA